MTGPACEACGTTLRDASRFCPSCGRPVPSAPAGKVPSPKTVRSLPPTAGPAQPPAGGGSRLGWIGGVAIVVLVSVAGILAAAVLLADGEDPVTEPEAISARDDDSSGATEASTPAPAEPTPPVTEAPTTVPSTPALPRIDPAWIGIIDSLDVDVFTYEQAVAAAQALTDRGIPSEVLFSTNYLSLNEGYWVVYSGVFSTEDPTSDHCVSIQPRLSTNCYPRAVDGYRAAAPPL